VPRQGVDIPEIRPREAPGGRVPAARLRAPPPGRFPPQNLYSSEMVVYRSVFSKGLGGVRLVSSSTSLLCLTV
jgi:hypothetical protein